MTRIGRARVTHVDPDRRPEQVGRRQLVGEQATGGEVTRSAPVRAGVLTAAHRPQVIAVGGQRGHRPQLEGRITGKEADPCRVVDVRKAHQPQPLKHAAILP
jgi:hypothetical protein